jgi:DNA-binding transcriptional ArsR family regulator
VNKIDIKSEWILYYIRDQTTPVGTPEIDDRYSDISYSAIAYRLRKLRTMGLVKSRTREEGKGGVQPTNYYTHRPNKVKLYKEENGDLSVPTYVYARRLDELKYEFESWQEYLQKLAETTERRIKALEDVVYDE